MLRRRIAAVSPATWIWVAAAVGLVARIGYVLATPHFRAVNDAADYWRLAHLIATGHGFGYSIVVGHGSTAFRAPAYPVFLAGVRTITDSLTATRLVQAFVGALTVGLAGLLAKECLGARVGVASAALCAVYPPLVAGSSTLVAEVMFTPLMLLMLLIAVRSRRAKGFGIGGAVLVGVTGGLAVLARPNGFLAFFVAVVVFLYVTEASWRTRIVRSAVALVVAGLVVMPWLVRTALEFHRFVPVTDQSGFVLAGTYNEQARTDPRWPGAWRPENLVPSLRPIVDNRRQNELQLSQALQHAAVSYAKAHPGYVVEAVAFNTARLLDLGESSFARQSAAAYGLGEQAAIVDRWAFRVALAMGLAGLVIAGGRRTALPLWLTPLLLGASTVIASGDVRYRIPIEPFVVVFAATTVVWILARANRAAPATAVAMN